MLFNVNQVDDNNDCFPANLAQEITLQVDKMTMTQWSIFRGDVYTLLGLLANCTPLYFAHSLVTLSTKRFFSQALESYENASNGMHFKIKYLNILALSECHPSVVMLTRINMELHLLRYKDTHKKIYDKETEDDVCLERLFDTLRETLKSSFDKDCKECETCLINRRRYHSYFNVNHFSFKHLALFDEFKNCLHHNAHH